MNFHKFFEIVDDPDVFMFRGRNMFNLFNMMSYHKERQQHRTAKPGTVKNAAWLIGRFTAFVRSLVIVIRLSLTTLRRRPVLLYGATGRHLKIDDQTFDLYNSRIIDELGRDQFVLIEDEDDLVNKVYRADFYVHDFAVIIGAMLYALRFFMSSSLNAYARRVNSTYPALDLTQQEITRRIALFYAKYWLHRVLLLLLRPRQALVIAYYGKEDFIAACRDTGVKITELMHGHMIVHPFYIFPESYQHLFRQAPFPDKLAVYGDFWKAYITQNNVFPASAVMTLGYYLKIPDTSPRTLSAEKNAILLTGGAVGQQDIYDYVCFLKSRLDRRKWFIVIKPHPVEDDSRYKEITEPGFVELISQDAYSLLAQADIHISIISTLLYEALRYNVANYSLHVLNAPLLYYEIIKSGVSRPIDPNELPNPNERPSIDPDEFFAEYNPKVLFKV